MTAALKEVNTMARRRKCFVRDVIQAVSEIAPPRLAESWDNVGLQIGDPSRAITRIMTCLEVTENIIEEAAGRQVDPPVCEPRAAPTVLEATATDDPLLEPPGVCSKFQGL